MADDDVWSLLNAALTDDDLEIVDAAATAQRACVEAGCEPGPLPPDTDVIPTTKCGTIAFNMTCESPLRPGTPPTRLPRVMETDEWMDDTVVSTAAKVYKLHRINARESGTTPPPGFIVDTFAVCIIWRRYARALHLAIKRGVDAPSTIAAVDSLRRIMRKTCGGAPVPATSVSCAMPCQVGWACRDHPTGWRITRTRKGKDGKKVIVIDGSDSGDSDEEGSLFTSPPGFKDKADLIDTLDPLQWWRFLDRDESACAADRTKNSHWATITVSADRTVVPGPRNGAGMPTVVAEPPKAMDASVLVEVRDTMLGSGARNEFASSYAPLCILSRAMVFIMMYARGGIDITADTIVAFHNASVKDSGRFTYCFDPDQVWLVPVPQQIDGLAVNTNICGVVTAAALLDIMVTGGRSSRNPRSGLSFGDVAIIATDGSESQSTSLMRIIILSAQTLGTVPGYFLTASAAQTKLLTQYADAWKRYMPTKDRDAPKKSMGPAKGKRKARE